MLLLLVTPLTFKGRRIRLANLISGVMVQISDFFWTFVHSLGYVVSFQRSELSCIVIFLIYFLQLSKDMQFFSGMSGVPFNYAIFFFYKKSRNNFMQLAVAVLCIFHLVIINFVFPLFFLLVKCLCRLRLLYCPSPLLTFR